MKVKKNQVFLVSGQQKAISKNSASTVPEISQRVVIAEDVGSTYALLSERDPNFVPIGHASLEEYETTIAKLRATLKGEATGWKLLISPEMNT